MITFALAKERTLIMLKIQSFGSGSSGNLYHITTDKGQIFIDAGIPIRKLRKLFREHGVSPSKIDGILITHDHADHVRSVGALNKKNGIEIYATHLVSEGIKSNPAISQKPLTEKTHTITKGNPFYIAGMKVVAFEVPHDSHDNVGYLLTYENTRLCIVTDCGKPTVEIENHISQATHLILESNYDKEMLENGPYPLRLRRRITNGFGHLSNDLAAEIIQRHRHHLKKVWLCHISENNNTPTLALTTTKKAADELTIVALDREKPSTAETLE